MAFQKWWYGGDAGQPFDSTTTFNADGYVAFDTAIPLDGTLFRTLVNVGIYTVTKTVLPTDTLWDPSWYVNDVIFNIAISSNDASGAPFPPLVPEPTQDGNALWIWTAALSPRFDQFITTPSGTTQVVRWEVNPGIRMESFARRGPFEGDSPGMWLSWSVIDVGGFFNNNGADIQSYTGGRVQTWHMYQQPA